MPIDLNADVGESFGVWSLGQDLELLPLLSSVNVACGFHAGDPLVINHTVAAAVAAGLAVGAHPGYFDLRGFGRRAQAADPEQVEQDVLYQVGALAAFARAHGTRLRHVKPHGALYNQAATDPPLARAVARGVARADPSLLLLGLASSVVMRESAAAEGLRFVAEAFADRRYRRDGSLTPRDQPGAVLTDPAQVAAQAIAIARHGRAMAAEGASIPLQAETLCLHGDNPAAIANARAVRAALEAAGVQIRPLTP